MNPSEENAYYFGLEKSPIFHNDSNRPFVEWDNYVFVDGEINKQCFIRKNRSRPLEEIKCLLRKTKKFHMIDIGKSPYTEHDIKPEIQKVVDDFYTENHGMWFRTRITLDELQEANTNMNEFHTHFFPERFIYQNVEDGVVPYGTKKKISVQRKK